MAEEAPSEDQCLLDPVGLGGMDLLMYQMLSTMAGNDPQLSLTDSASASSEEAKTCWSSSSHSPPHSLTPSQGDVQPDDQSQQTETVLQCLNRKFRSSPPLQASFPNRDTYYECFSTLNASELEALVYSLFVTTRGVARDGYEHYECLSRTKHKCRYRVRARVVNGLYTVEERGCHSHPFDASAFNSQGLPRTIREIVDVSFNESWTNQRRQEAVDAEVFRLGLPPNPKMNRQIDNRLSYLRRTKNIAASNVNLVNQAMAGIPDLSTLYGSQPTGNESVQEGTENNIFHGLDINAALAQLLAAQNDSMTRGHMQPTL